MLPSPLPPHPRLLANADSWEEVKVRVHSDPVSARIFCTLRRKADALLKLPCLGRVMTGFRLLYVSRLALERISILAGVFRIVGERKYAARAMQELEAICRFEDWNPSHHLDTAEMALAVAIGYDWLYEQLDESARELIGNALLEKGLNPSLSEPQKYWWITGTNNWNQVCHAGISAAAIAIADREPEKAEHILQRAVKNIAFSAVAYAPDGAYPEGPMYWNYGTSFHVVLAAALQELTGSTQGVDDYPGLAESAHYMVQMTAPSGHLFNYSDCQLSRHLLIPLFWMARQYKHPEWLTYELSGLDGFLEQYEREDFHDSNYRLLILALLWRDPTPFRDARPNPAQWMAGGSVPVVVIRGSNPGRNLYFAIKGGSPSASHGHMDIGSFVLEADGIRWAVDPGMQQYESLEGTSVNPWLRGQDEEGWSVFRLGPESHSILRFNGQSQVVAGKASFIRFEDQGRAYSVLDLTPIYETQIASVARGVLLTEEDALQLQDEWTAADTDLEVSWQWMTEASVDVRGNVIQLEQAGQTLTLQILETAQPYIVVLEEASELMRPYDAENPGLRRICIRMSTLAGERGILRVLATPGTSA